MLAFFLVFDFIKRANSVVLNLKKNSKGRPLKLYTTWNFVMLPYLHVYTFIFEPPE